MEPSVSIASIRDQVARLESILIAYATTSIRTDEMSSRQVGELSLEYIELRNVLHSDLQIRELLPNFVNECRTLAMFWDYITDSADNYKGRRKIINRAFTELSDALEDQLVDPGDAVIAASLQALNVASVEEVWRKAIARRHSDPAGAITAARTLLESVIKAILDKCAEDYSSKDSLPKLYKKTAELLTLAPSPESEAAIKEVLGGVISLVNGIGTLRNKVSDAHGSHLSVAPSIHHAELAVNTAGAVAAFLVQRYQELK